MTRVFYFLFLVGFSIEVHANPQKCLQSIFPPYQIEEYKIGKNVIEVKRINHGLRFGFFDTRKLHSPTSVFIGVSPEGGHSYILAAGKRFDTTRPGNFIFSKVVGDIRSQAYGASRGLLFRFDDGTGEFARKISHFVEQNGMPRSFSCVGSTCEVMFKSNAFQMDQKTFQTMLPVRFSKKFIKAKQVRSDGQMLLKEVYVIGDEKISSMLGEMRKVQNVGIQEFLLVPVPVSIVGGALVVAALTQENLKPTPTPTATPVK